MKCSTYSRFPQKLLCTLSLCLAAATLTSPAMAVVFQPAAPLFYPDLRVQFNIDGYGSFVVELDDNTPLHRDNFLRYVDTGTYDNTIIHRSEIWNGDSGVVQGGGFAVDTQAAFPLSYVPTHAAVQNEAALGGSNTYMSLAAARGDGLDSATSQWYVNMGDNSADLDSQSYTVFGNVVAGQDVVEAIHATPTYDWTIGLWSVYGPYSGGGMGPFTSLPLSGQTVATQYPQIDASWQPVYDWWDDLYPLYVQGETTGDWSAFNAAASDVPEYQQYLDVVKSGFVTVTSVERLPMSDMVWLGSQDATGNLGGNACGAVDWKFNDLQYDGPIAIQFSAGDEADFIGNFGAGPSFDTGEGGLIQMWDIQFDGEFDGTVELTFNYDPSMLTEDEIAGLGIWHQRADGTWELLETVDHNIDLHTITVLTDSFSPFVAGQVPEPGILGVMGIGMVGLITRNRRKRKLRNRN